MLPRFVMSGIALMFARIAFICSSGRLVEVYGATSGLAPKIESIKLAITVSLRRHRPRKIQMSEHEPCAEFHQDIHATPLPSLETQFVDWPRPLANSLFPQEIWRSSSI